MTAGCRSSKPTPTLIKDSQRVGESSSCLSPQSKALTVTCNPIKYPEGHADCRFLDLPAELRSAIYSAAFKNGGDSLPLLQTCHQIHMESEVLLNQRPITFSSQAKFFSWIADTDSAELKRVKTIKLHLTDIDLSSLFDPRPIADRGGGRSSSCWYLYSAELLRLDQALQALSGLVELTIIPPERPTSLMRGMYLSFLEVIPQRCPRLKLLTIYDQESLLQKIPGLKKVPRVVFLDPRDLKSGFVVPVKSEIRDREVKIKMETEW